MADSWGVWETVAKPVQCNQDRQPLHDDQLQSAGPGPCWRWWRFHFIVTPLSGHTIYNCIRWGSELGLFRLTYRYVNYFLHIWTYFYLLYLCPEHCWMFMFTAQPCCSTWWPLLHWRPCQRWPVQPTWCSHWSVDFFPRPGMIQVMTCGVLHLHT